MAGKVGSKCEVRVKPNANWGTLYVVSTPIGDLEDVTLRALRVLRDVAVIAAEDPQQTRALCERYKIGTPLTSYHNDNKEEKAAVLLARLRAGDSIALVSDAGTPVIADPGRFLIREAIKAGIRVTPVPGPSATMAAVAVSGLSGDRFLFQGSLPGTSVALHRLLRTLRNEHRTLVLFASAGRLSKALHAVRKILGERYIVVAKDLTMPGELCIRGKAGEVLRQVLHEPLDGSITLVIEGCRGRAEPTRGANVRLRKRVSGS